MKVVKKVICVILRIPAMCLGGLLITMGCPLVRFAVGIARKEYPGCDYLKTAQDRLQAAKPGQSMQYVKPMKNKGEWRALPGYWRWN